MIKKQYLVVLMVLCASFMGFGQISITGLGAGNTYSQDFNSLASTGTSSTVPAGWSFSESGTNADTMYTAGTGSVTAGDTYSFGPSGNTERSFGGLLSGSLIPTIGVSFTNNTGFTITDLIISYKGETWRVGTASRSDRMDFQYSINATSLTTGTWTDFDALDYANPGQAIGSGSQQHSANISSNITGLSIINGSTFWFRWNDLNALGADDGMAIDDFSIYVIGATDDVDWCNVDPVNGIIDLGNQFYVYAQAWENGVTNSPGQGAGLLGWIGYSTANTDPSGGGWIWVAASYFDEVGNNDRFRLDIGSVIPTIGTYYYASRFQLNGGPYSYGGFNAGGGGFWNGTTNVNGVLTINARTLDWCNLQSPNVGSISLGNTYNVFAQVYEPGITENSPAQPGANIQAWIGYSTADNDPSVSGGWTWLPAGHNTLCGANCGFPTENNDEYFTDIGSGLPVGTYYYASRFTIDDPSIYYYGGWSGTGGGFWNGTTNVNGVLTVTLADVVITEIMYNTTGIDDEWIEICNVSGSAQDISNYIIDVGGSTVFTFPSNTTIASGFCITVSLGSNGDGTYNNGDGTLVGGNCPFPPDYGIGATADDTDKLFNNAIVTITLYAANGSTPTDSVTYDDIDGGDGNGSSLHVIDASQDNSNASSNWQEVAYGGSAGFNTLLPNCLPAGIEINVEGNLGNFPDIADGHISPSPLDNTLFAAQFVGASQSKSYRIQSLFSTDVIISNITITGHSTDFTVTSAPASPVNYLTPSILEITFSPTVPGPRTAVVHIFNNDADESEYTFTIEGNGLCATSSNTITPSSGPVGTMVTVTGTNLSTATASFNGVNATVNNISTTEMEVIVPNGAVTGNLEIIDSLSCTSTIPFTVIDNLISSCEGGSALSELFISEVTDATYGSLTYVEIYNATGSSVDLSTYSISIYANGNTNPSNASTQALSGILAPNSIYVLTMGVQPPLNGSLCSVTGGDGSLGAISSTTLFGINKKDNEHDFIGLYNSSVLVDSFGVFGDDDWMDTLHTTVTGDRGFDFRRLNTATPLPQPTFDDNDWIIIDWAGSGTPSCESTNDYSDIGIYDFSTGTPPSVDSGPTISSSCNTATISVTGTEGFAGSKSLTYQWYYSAPGYPGWTMVPDDATYDDVTLATLNIIDTSALEGYQYYCQIREDDSSCYTASDAVQLTLPRTTWTSGAWTNGAPTISTIVYIDDDYDTGIDGSFSACNLVVNDDGIGGFYTLTIADNTYVEVENNLIVNGKIIVNPKGSFVQVNDNGAVTVATQTSITVEKETAPMDAWYEYTYWSSPVSEETINLGLSDASTNRRFWFDAQNYKDSEKENGNSGNYSSGQDDIDDNGDDWTLTSGSDTMLVGVGYASTHNATIFNGTPGPLPHQFKYTFEGPFNNGIIDVPVYRNDDEMADNNWNLIGNPYPSAIFVDDFLTVNAGIFTAVPLSPPVDGLNNGAIFLWSQASPPSANNPGNQNQNFKQSDYAIINWTMQAAGGDGVIPSRYIPSGQSFFIAYDNLAPGNLISISGDDIYEGNVTFNNSMRVTDNNNLFFRSSNGSQNKLWLNLTSDNGIFNQTALGYVENATDAYDGMAYDTPRNLATELFSTIYTTIDDEDKKFAIQGKDPNSLNLKEIIGIGFETSIDVPTLYTLSIGKVEGNFLSTNTIYLKDNLMNIVHDLSASNYSFTSEVGEFNDRFKIVFDPEVALSLEDQIINNTSLSIIEHDSGQVQFKLSSPLQMKSIEIIDVLGRTLYKLPAEGNSKTYNLSNLSRATYIAKVELSNGIIITKKAIKRK